MGFKVCFFKFDLCGYAAPTAEGDYVELLRMARGALVRPSLLLPRSARGGGGGGGDGDERMTGGGDDSEDESAEEEEDDEPSAAEARAELVEAVGLYKLTSVDPELESAWFQPLNL
jgi:hypothetical protein